MTGRPARPEDSPRVLGSGWRSLLGAITGRANLANRAGISFEGKRDVYKALGYPRTITLEEYRSTYLRNAVAARIVESKPEATWRVGGEIIEDEDPDVSTPFEQAWQELDTKHRVWNTFKRADTLAGLGRYAVILIGAPGKLEEELTSVTELLYLQTFGEGDAKVAEYDLDKQSERYGLPKFYSLSRTTQPGLLPSPVLPPDVTTISLTGQLVHWTRVIHVADGALDDPVMGVPRLERVWNLLIDLEKVTGGGAEAFWKRADPGMQLDLDPDVDFTEADEQKLDEALDKYTHGLERIMKTRGVTMNPLTSSVADFRGPTNAIFDQISAGTGIPQRILMGSERGELASSQDTEAWYERISDRRHDFAGPVVARPFVDRMIELGVLPQPKKPYVVRWPEMRNLSDSQRAEVAGRWAELNQKSGELVVTGDEIRDRVMGLPPLTAEQRAEHAAQTEEVTPPLNEPPTKESPNPADARAARIAEIRRNVAARWGDTPTAEANAQIILDSEGLTEGRLASAISRLVKRQPAPAIRKEWGA